jgi:hypothetical protein
MAELFERPNRRLLPHHSQSIIALLLDGGAGRIGTKSNANAIYLYFYQLLALMFWRKGRILSLR